MKALMILTIAWGVLTAGGQVLPGQDRQAAGSARQYYGPWKQPRTGGYSYRVYYFKPDPADRHYQHHYVIDYPSRGRYLYYFNPEGGFWGRYDPRGSAQKLYSVLDEKDRKKDLKDIPESAFPDPGPMPVIPGAQDGVRMTPPPKDMPGETGRKDPPQGDSP